MSTNIIESVIEKYDSLTASKPKYLYWDYLPVKNPDGTAVGLPIIMFRDGGSSQNITFAKVTTEVYKFRFFAYDVTYDDSRSIFNTVMFNGEDPQNLAGFAYCTTFPVPTGYRFEQCTVLEEARTSQVVDKRTNTAVNCYMTTWVLGLQVQRNI